MGAMLLPVGPGKTAPRLIQDLLEHDSRRVRNGGRNILTDQPPPYRAHDSQNYPLRSLPSECTHRLWRKETQSSIPAGDDLSSVLSKHKSASYCERCFHHYDIVVDYSKRSERKRPCGAHPEYPLHHLIHKESWPGNANEGSTEKYDTTRELHCWTCSAPECPATVTVAIRPPRLSSERLSCITDPTKVFVRGQKAILENPDRYQDKTPMLPIEILVVLRTYLSDAISRKPDEIKRIAVRNKKFLLAFANDCDDLLRYLDFTSHSEPNPNGNGPPEEFWILPNITTLGDANPTKSNLTFLEDAITELSQRITLSPIEEQRRVLAKTVYQPMPALKDIRRILGCEKYERTFRPINFEVAEHPHYAALGAVGDFSDALIMFAYARQRENDPAARMYYLECLQGIAHGRGSEDLLEELAKAASLGEKSLREVDDAYKYLSIDPNVDHGDDYIIGIYMSRIESAPVQRDEAKQCLETIGMARNSAKILEVAKNKEMTIADAYNYLGVQQDTVSDMIDATAVAMALDGNKERVINALRTIAKSRNEDFVLHQAAQNLESGGADYAMTAQEAYKRLQIDQPDSLPDESVLYYYRSLTDNAAAGSRESFKEAFKVIAMTRQSSFLLERAENPDVVVVSPLGTADKPVGLDNIGNTCYLNSLLQYYYTVVPVRNVVMNFSDYRMSLDVENMRYKRVGGRAVTKAETEKAQKFVEELRTLFQNLRTAPTQSVRPTQNLAELTLLSTATEANFRRASISSPVTTADLDPPVFGPHLPPPPPLGDLPSPPIPSRPAPTPSTEEQGIGMVKSASYASGEHDDSQSDSTLVELENAGTAQLEKLAVSKEIPVSPIIGEATTFVSPPDGNEVVMSTAPLMLPSDIDGAPFDFPPPVPPRTQKPQLIKTSHNAEERLRSEKLGFGAQQDVTEVIGNVMFRLQCAIKPTSFDSKFGEQIDVIRDTFYGANAVYLKKANGYDKKVEDWANIIVFPDPVATRNIYEALDVVFDEQFVEIDNTETTQYTAIDKLPPVLQIQIQRTAFDSATQRASKNQNQIAFEETIYMDRYMDSERIAKRRRDSWRWKSRIRQLEARFRALVPAHTNDSLPVPEALSIVKEFLVTLDSGDDGIVVDKNLSDALEERAEEIVDEIASIKDELASLKKCLTNQFTDLRDYRYRLQAVFMHRGSNASGHYWVYIYDFTSDVWREYNDDRVSITNRKFVFEQQSGGSVATPYYLVYVRDDMKEQVVEAVCREILEPSHSTETDHNMAGMTTGAESRPPQAEHIEFATTRDKV